MSQLSGTRSGRPCNAAPEACAPPYLGPTRRRCHDRALRGSSYQPAPLPRSAPRSWPRALRLYSNSGVQGTVVPRM